MSRLRCVISFFMCFVFVQTASAQVANFDAMYVFGDSLSDNGNDLILSRLFGAQPAIPPSESPNRTYYRGRFSNGPVAFEYLWRRIKQNPNAIVKPSFTFALPSRPGAISYAFGGATSGVSALARDYWCTRPRGAWVCWCAHGHGALAPPCWVRCQVTPRHRSRGPMGVSMSSSRVTTALPTPCTRPAAGPTW